MAVPNKIFIPTFISSVDYQPVRTLPHIYFYNGLKDCEPYYVEHYQSGSTSVVQNTQLTKFPYVDYYDGLEPTTGSNSLLFFNETPPYGVTPTGSLYTQYWDTYVSLLYNPKTRLINASGIIPLADYFDMELNDIVQWRGNYYHLRAINDYNLKDGTCNLQLLGPIIRDAVSVIDCSFNFSSSVENPPFTTTTLSPTTSTTLSPTTSTTLSPTTSTTLSPTTTVAQTTSTTTVVCVCDEWEIANNSQTPGDTVTYSYTDCNTQTTLTGSVPYDSSDTVCSCDIPVRISGPTPVITNLGSCLLPLTTTTTVAPTTLAPSTTTVSPTTTAAPTTSTTTQAGIVTSDLAYFFNLVTGSFIYQPETWGFRTFDYILKDTVTGSIYFGLFGIDGTNKNTSSLGFNGSNEWGWIDIAQMPTSGSTFTSSSVTLEAWINHQSGQPNLYSVNQSFVMSYRFGSSIPFMDIGRDSGSYTTIEGTMYDGVDKDTVPGATITQDIFYHWAHTFDTSTNQHYLYRNGTLIGSGSTSDEYNFSYPEFHIAEDYNSENSSTIAERRLQKIRIGNTRVYKKALSGAEILQNYNSEKSLYGL